MSTQHITGPVIALFISVSALLGQGEGSLWALYETGECPDFVEAARRQPIDSLSAQLCFYTGVCFKELSDFQSALEFLDQAIRKDPDMAMAYFYKAEVLFQLNRLPEALIQYDNAIHLRPEVPDFQVSKGHALFQAWRYPEAIACFEKALKLPNCPDQALIYLGRAYQQNKQIDLSLSTYYGALDILDPLGPEYMECLHRLGLVEYLKGDYPAAEAVFLRLLAQKPNDYQGISKLIQVYFAQEAFEKGNALKMQLYGAYNKGLLPRGMATNGFCFDQFEWEGKRVYAYERMEEPPGYYAKHVFMVTGENDQVLQVIQTEHTLSAAKQGKKYVLGRVEGGNHTIFEDELFDDNFDYPTLKKAVIKVLKGKAK